MALKFCFTNWNTKCRKKIEWKTCPSLSEPVSLFFRFSIKDNSFLIIQIGEHDLIPLNICVWNDLQHCTQATWDMQCSSQSLYWLIVLFICMAWFCIGFFFFFFATSKYTLLANRIPAAVLISRWVHVPLSHLWYANIILAMFLWYT